MLTENAHES